MEFRAFLEFLMSETGAQEKKGFQWFIFIMISYKMQTLRNFEKKIEEILIVKIK